MPAVRRKYHYSRIVLSDEIVFPNKALCGHSVPVITNREDTKNVKFGGFVSAGFGKTVYIKDIVAYTEGDGLRDWIDLPKGTILKAQIIRNKAYIVWPLITKECSSID